MDKPMNKEEVRKELLARADQLRVLPLEKWIQRDPRTAPPGYQCAILGLAAPGIVWQYLGYHEMQAVNAWLKEHEDFWSDEWNAVRTVAPGLSEYNDYIAKSPTDVAILLEKVAADL